MKKALLISLLLSGCETKGPPGPRPHEVGHSKLEPQILLTYRGCEVGRIWDGKYTVYLTFCPEGRSSSQSLHIEGCGKGCTRTVSVQQMQEILPRPLTSPPEDVAIPVVAPIPTSRSRSYGSAPACPPQKEP